MKDSVKALIYWSPRVLGILFALFISIFAMDVFSEERPFLETLVALFMHLIPTFLVVIVLIAAWRREWIGAVIFIGLGLFYIVFAWGRFHISAYFAIAGPLIIMGIIFALNWKYRTEIGRH